MRPFSLICLPWPAADMAPIQLGLLGAVLDRDGVPHRAHSFHLKFLEFCATDDVPLSQRLTPEEYAQVGGAFAHLLPGEWVFAVPPVRPPRPADDNAFANLLRRGGMDGKLVKKLFKLRSRVPRFLDACAEEVLAADPFAVGFTVGYTGRFAAVSLAQRIKALRPDVTTVFGGSQCEGTMGAAMLRAFDAIDIVVSGEGEGVLPRIAGALQRGEPVPALRNVHTRQTTPEPTNNELPERVRLDAMPLPDYTEYFTRLRSSPLATQLIPDIPIETSRGCWWGERSHCTFCGINAEDMAFRSKSPTRVVEEIVTLSRKHAVLDFTALDNVIDSTYFDTLLPELTRRDIDVRLFYEVRATMSREEVEKLRRAGVHRIQPGIESLSTPTLKLMAKGTTAIHNLRLLKWCRELGIGVDWNLLYGFPNEDPTEYHRIADWIPWFVHLDPPHLGRLGLDRFSPYHHDPESFGLRNLGPGEQYQLLYDVDDALLGELAQFFSYEYLGGDKTPAYRPSLESAVKAWRRDAPQRRLSLTYRRGPDFVKILDARQQVANEFVLDELDAAVYAACDAGSSAAKITAQLDGAATENRVQSILDDFESERLVFRENRSYLSLAVPAK